MKKSFRSRIGTGIAIVLIASCFLAVFCTYRMPLAICLVVNVLYIGFVAGAMVIRYDIVGTELHIRTFYALTKKVIDINSIKSVEPSRDAISSPAASTKRLLIKYNEYDEVLISPVREEEFISTLQQINPEIKFYEEKY